MTAIVKLCVLLQAINFANPASLGVVEWTGQPVVPQKVALGEKVVLRFEATHSLQQQYVKLSHVSGIGTGGFNVMFVKESDKSTFDPVGWGSAEVDSRFHEEWAGNVFTFTIDVVEAADIGLFMAELRDPQDIRRVVDIQKILLYTGGKITPAPRLESAGVYGPQAQCPPESTERTTVILICVIAVLVTIIITVGLVILCLRYKCRRRITLEVVDDGCNQTRCAGSRECGLDATDGNATEMVVLSNEKCKNENEEDPSAPAQCTDFDTEADRLLQSEKDRRTFTEPSNSTPEVDLGESMLGAAGGDMDEPDGPLPQPFSPPPANSSEPVHVTLPWDKVPGRVVIAKHTFEELMNAVEFKEPLRTDALQSGRSMYYSMDEPGPLGPIPDIGQPQYVSALDVPETILNPLGNMANHIAKKSVAKILELFDGLVNEHRDGFEQFKKEIPEDDEDNFANNYMLRHQLDESVVRNKVMKCLHATSDSDALFQVVQYPRDVFKNTNNPFFGKFLLLACHTCGEGAVRHVQCVEYWFSYELASSVHAKVGELNVSESDILQYVTFRAIEAFKQKGLVSSVRLEES